MVRTVRCGSKTWNPYPNKPQVRFLGRPAFYSLSSVPPIFLFLIINSPQEHQVRSPALLPRRNNLDKSACLIHVSRGFPMHDPTACPHQFGLQSATMQSHASEQLRLTRKIGLNVQYAMRKRYYHPEAGGISSLTTDCCRIWMRWRDPRTDQGQIDKHAADSASWIGQFQPHVVSLTTFCHGRQPCQQ